MKKRWGADGLREGHPKVHKETSQENQRERNLEICLKEDIH